MHPPVRLGFRIPEGVPKPRTQFHCPGGAPESSRSVERGTSGTTGIYAPLHCALKGRPNRATPPQLTISITTTTTISISISISTTIDAPPFGWGSVSLEGRPKTRLRPSVAFTTVPGMKEKMRGAVKGVGKGVSHVVTRSAGTVSGAVTGTLGALGRTVRGIGASVLGLTAAPVAPTIKRSAPGAAPGIEHYLKEGVADIPVAIDCLDYGESFFEHRKVANLTEFLDEPRPEGARVRWLNLEGLNPQTVNELRERFGFHTLAAEDVIQPLQRPKCEVYADHLFLIVRMIQIAGGKLRNEQVSIFRFGDTLLTIQEAPGDVFSPVRKRIEQKGPRFLQYGTDYLLYALVDSIVDHLYPLVEGYGAALEAMEEVIVEEPRRQTQRQLFAIKRDLSLLRRTLWPMREVVDAVYRDDTGIIADPVKTFLRDVYDHAMQIIDIVETYRETASGLNDLYQSAVGNKMNEIMKVLTIMASFFIPITFVAGVYGMNFEHIPELDWRYAYFAFWGVCLSMTLGLAVYFWRKGWIGGRDQ